MRALPPQPALLLHAPCKSVCLQRNLLPSACITTAHTVQMLLSSLLRLPNRRLTFLFFSGTRMYSLSCK